jgi:predicted heme/steroid binding protein/uncharacterized membrane protein
LAAFRDVDSGPIPVTGGEKTRPSSRGRVALVLLVVFCALAFLPSPGSGTEEYAAQTGKRCGACHVDPSGGGRLTPEGEAYRRYLTVGGQPVPEPSRWRHTVRFVAGFLHLFTAVLWFGTILYVHLLLKPSYASHGLPRGELMVGWGSIIVIALTGVVLTVFRIRSPGDLLHTRFGILLTVKIALFLIMVGIAAIVTFIVGPRLKKRRASVDRGKKDMTLNDLSAFDGKEGRPAYFAYDGRVFDATRSQLWRDGSHVGRHLAGFDLTDFLKLAPHGEEKVASMPSVGNLLATGTIRRTPTHLKAFYFMTYFTLGLIFAILFIISLWRWG